MTLRKTLLYFLIFTVFASFFTYKIVVKAYDSEDAYNIDSLKS